MMGTDTLIAAVLVIAFVVPLYNILDTIVLSYYDSSGRSVSVRKLLLGIVKNPLIISIVLGLPFSLFHRTIPTMFSKTLSYLGQLATPLALLLIGANLRPETFRRKPRGILLATAVKIIVSPLLGTAAAWALGFRGEELITLFVMFAVPAAANSYIMTRKLGGDAEVGAGIVMVSTLGSILTLTAGIYLFRLFGWV